jgi:8-oxo-dGTP pyrophosphatase MutT (NUDIX family)
MKHMAHNNYYLDLCVDTFIVNNGAVLLRLHDKYNNWNVPGGHIDPNEDLNEAAHREVWEEVGLKVELVPPPGWIKEDTDSNKDLVPPHFLNRHRINDTHEHSAAVFFARSNTREINPQSQEDKDSASPCVWVTLDELEEMYKSDKRLRYDAYRYAKAALTIVK